MVLRWKGLIGGNFARAVAEVQRGLCPKDEQECQGFCGETPQPLWKGRSRGWGETPQTLGITFADLRIFAGSKLAKVLEAEPGGFVQPGGAASQVFQAEVHEDGKYHPRQDTNQNEEGQHDAQDGERPAAGGVG